MSAEIVPFLFDGSQIRTLLLDGDLWFVGRDVATTLGYAKPQNAIETHCKGALKRGLPSSSGIQEYTIIPERDVYRLIMRSKLQSAEKFEEWVVGEVLPSIRKTGSFTATPRSYAEALRALADLEEAKERLALQNADMKPKAEYFDCAMTSERGMLIRDVAKLLHPDVPGGLGEKRLFYWLRANKWIYIDQAGENRAYQTKIDSGYLAVTERPIATNNHGTIVKVTVRVTPKGRVAIHKALMTEVV